MQHEISTFDQADCYIREQIAAITDGQLAELAKDALFMPGYTEAPSSSGTNGKHHLMIGGNYIHTAQVLRTALAMLESVPAARTEHVVVAVLWHDAAKGLDYRREDHGPYQWIETPDGVQYPTTDHYKFIRHLVGSAMAFREACIRRLLENYDGIMHIEHIILAHHGRKEWGSPVEPQTPEAWAVHAADMMSAQFLEN